MFRRLLRSWVAIALALVGVAAILAIIVTVMQLSNGSLVISPTPKSEDQNVSAPDGWPSSGSVSNTPQETPPVIENSLVPVSHALDTSGFDHPAVVVAWDVRTDYANVSVALTNQDWQELAKQLDIDPTSDPLRVQPYGAAIQSLINVDQAAQDILTERQKAGLPPFDIRTGETYYYLSVGN